MKNNQIIHITAEVIIITGVCFYFSRKTKALNNRIDILTQKLEEQQELINKHEDIISQLLFRLSELNQYPISNPIPPIPPIPPIHSVNKKTNKKTNKKEKTVKQPKNIKKVRFDIPLEEEEKELTEEELDEELKDELSELKEDDDVANID